MFKKNNNKNANKFKNKPLKTYKTRLNNLEI